MNEKLSLQHIADALAQKAGASKKVGETFAKAFFETVVEALSQGEESIKVKGLGTFKLVQVDSRESVNVKNGQRIVIAGYKKVAFTPEESVVEVLIGHAEEVISQTDSADSADQEENSGNENINEGSASDTEEGLQPDPDIDTLIEVPAPTTVEQPQDAFGGIDLLISTPESVEEVRQQYEEARVKMEAAVAEARKANAEKLRLEKLLERLEKNLKPEEEERRDEIEASQPDSTENTGTQPTSTESSEKEPDVVNDEAKRREAFNRVMTEQPKPVDTASDDEKSHKRGWLNTAIVLLLVVLGTLVYLIHRNIEAVEQVPTIAQTKKPAKPIVPKPAKTAKPVKPAAPKVDKDSLAKAAKADSIKVVDTKKDTQAKPERPKTHRMQRGESLTKISQMYYGTKDSVRAILRVNAFNDPNNLPVGTVVNLP